MLNSSDSDMNTDRARRHSRHDRDCVDKVLGTPELIEKANVVLRYYWLKEQVEAGTVVLEKVNTHVNIADIFTKPLAKKLYEQHARKMLNTKHDPNMKGLSLRVCV